MFKAWRRAGRHLSAAPPVDLRWTRVCFCGQATSDGTVADEPEAGAPFLTGSEEGRGPLYDITHQPLEGDRSPTETLRTRATSSGSRSRPPRTATRARCRCSSSGSASG